jgi:hypothetical protein
MLRELIGSDYAENFCYEKGIPADISGVVPTTGTRKRKSTNKPPNNDFPTTAGQVKGSYSKEKFKNTVNREIGGSKMYHQDAPDEPIQCQVKVFMDGHSALNNAARRRDAGRDRVEGRSNLGPDDYRKNMEIFVWGLTEATVANYLYYAGPADIETRRFRFFYGKDGLRALYAAMFNQKAEGSDFSMV